MLIQHAVRALTQFLHVSAHQHLAECHEIAVRLIVDFDHAPWVCTSTYGASLGGSDFVIGADDGKRDFTLRGASEWTSVKVRHGDVRRFLDFRQWFLRPRFRTTELERFGYCDGRYRRGHDV